ncbi:unnamed protein product [Candidula unifasciata]|uniref:BHLH domain-containing protein n=1 Tax=Candidula unifasciata TaxID=100452 RepID=A0A8S3ZEK5_9EUPU|nr:unnamed protein product [Candidula unifasciata]
MPAAIAMAGAKISPVLAASAKPPSSSSSSIHSTGTSVSTISIPVSAFHDPASNVITITPYIFVKTATVAEQMQALRQDKKIGKPLDQPSGALRVKRRTDLSKLGLPDAKPASVSRRNARERNRVKQVNLGFETLREHVPNGKKNKKMSKVQTLRSAAQYIKDLYMILHGELPALGSPTVIDENEPDSPIENSAYSVSDTDNDASLGSPEPKFQQFPSSQHCQQLEQLAAMDTDAIPTSPVSSVFAQNIILSSLPQHHQQQHKQAGQLQSQNQPAVVVKTEYVSVLQQQLSRGQIPLHDEVAKQIKQQQQAPHQQRQEQQLQQVQQQHTQRDQQQQLQQQQEQLVAFSPSALRRDPLTCTTALGFANASTIRDTAASALRFTELSPISMDDEQCDNYMEVSPEQMMVNAQDDSSSTTNTNKIGDSNQTDIPASPSLLRSYMSDVNMNIISTNIIGSHQNDFVALQHYYKSVRNEHFKNADSLFPFQTAEKNNIINTFLIGQNSNVVHSPAPSLSSTASSISSENDICASGHYDYDNLDGEALLDISNWISEICSQGMHLNGELITFVLVVTICSVLAPCRHGLLLNTAT